jgi:hypothetical protein
VFGPKLIIAAPTEERPLPYPIGVTAGLDIDALPPNLGFANVFTLVGDTIIDAASLFIIWFR